MEEISDLYQRKKNVSNILRFISKLYTSGKIVELLSFIVWEFKYQLSLYDKNQTLQFKEGSALINLKKELRFSEFKSNDFDISVNAHNWYFLYLDHVQTKWGCLFENQKTLFKQTTSGHLQECFTFKNKIRELFIMKSGIIFCCSNGVLYKSNNGNSFKEVLKFTTLDSRFRKDGITETPNGHLFIGEYANVRENNRWKFAGYIYHSINNGESWQKLDFLKKAGINKHVHIVQWSNHFNGLIMADGDNQKNIWLNTSSEHFNNTASDSKLGWKKINKRHINKGGYTAILEVENQIILGTDYNGGTNFLVTTVDMVTFKALVIPNPYRRAIFDRITIRKNTNGALEIWATLFFMHHKSVKSLLMLSKDRGESWEKVIEYDGTKLELIIVSANTIFSEEIFLSLKSKNHENVLSLKIHS